jgi:hypothetical protein
MKHWIESSGINLQTWIYLDLRDKKKLEAGENFTVKSFVIRWLLLAKHCYDDNFDKT